MIIQPHRIGEDRTIALQALVNVCDIVGYSVGAPTGSMIRISGDLEEEDREWFYELLRDEYRSLKCTT